MAASMDLDSEIAIELPPLFRRYKSGRVERLMGTATVPPSVDPSTGVTSKDVIIDSVTGVTARLYLPNIPPIVTSPSKLPVLVYFHGGGFCICSASDPTYHRYLNSLVSKANVVAVSVSYRLAPEHPLPAAYDDSLAALRWVCAGEDPWVESHGDLKQVFLAGDSAGANIVHQMMLRAPDVELAGAVLVHPYFWGTERLGDEPVGEWRSFLEGMWKETGPAGSDVDHPYFNPWASDAQGMEGLRCQRMLVCVAEKDELASRGREYYERVKRSGWEGEVELWVAEEESHVFHLFKPECEKAEEMMEKLVSFIHGD